MNTYYGRIDLRKERMPPALVILRWTKEAKRDYDPELETRNLERFVMDYVWNNIAEWQEKRRRGR